MKIACLVAVILFGVWFWYATEPDKVVGKLDVKVGPGCTVIGRVNIFGRKISLLCFTYKLCLVDVYGQHFDVDVSRKDFEAAQFDKTAAWSPSRIRKHYRIDL